MESFRDQQVSQQLLELVPKYTVGYSPHFNDIVDFFTANAENTHDFLPYFMRKFQVYNEPTLATWATETPIDSAIICAFSHCLPQEEMLMHPDIPDAILLARFNFTLSKIFCLDYLDFISRVLRVITDCAFAYELYLWSRVEDSCPLDADADLDTWLDRSVVPAFLPGQTLNSVLDGTANVTKRTSLMLEALGEQYREVVMANINLRPQHVVGSYSISRNVAQ